MANDEGASTMTARIQSIAELASELDKTIALHTEADCAQIAAYHDKNEIEHERAGCEMARLDKADLMLIKAICRGRATTRDEAVIQAIMAMNLAKRVSEGGRR